MSKPWKKYYRKAKESFDKIRESESGIAVITGGLAAIFPPLAILGGLFRKETEPGSGVYETQPLINPKSIVIAGVAGLLVYTIIKKKK